MNKPIKKAETIIFLLYALLIAAFLVGILWINFHPGQWYNYDIYADAMVAKYMVQSRSLFPEGWTFGNQLYTVATPVVAAMFYAVLKDTVLSLTLASCLMTVLTLGSFLWCIAPFVGKRSKLVGLLCLVGGTIFGTTASSDPLGLQVFYTMASYYSCYIIGIFLTLGIFLRIYGGKKVPLWIVIMDLALNLLLSMQSLREMLVLDLPLVALGLLCLIGRKGRKTPLQGFAFSMGALASAGAGVILIKLLSVRLPISQISVIASKQGSLLAGVKHNIKTLGKYMGLETPTNDYGWMRLIGAVFCILMVLYATAELLRKHREEPLTLALLYGWISLGAVFCAGVLVIGTRPIYYFPWQILVAVSGAVVAEKLCTMGWKRLLFLVSLLAVGASSLYCNFRHDIGNFSWRDRACRGITRELLERGITHVYYDGEWLFYGPQIAAYSGDRITMPAVFPNKNGIGEGDLMRHVDYLASEEWFSPDNRHNAYLLLSEYSLSSMDPAYREALLSHLKPELEWKHIGVTYYFYSYDEALARDMNNED